MATRKKVEVKKYITVQNAVLLVITISIIVLVAMLFGGWSIRETKERIKPLENNQEVLKRQSESEKEINRKQDFIIDSMAKEMNRKGKERTKQIIIIQQKKDDRVKEITKPDFSNDDIRRSFAE